MVAQLDDAVLVLKKPTSGTWVDESSYGHVVTPVGSPSFSVDHFGVVAATDYFTIANHAILEPANGKDLTWLVIYDPDDTTPPAVEKWMEKSTIGAGWSSSAGYRLVTTTGGHRFAVIENRGDEIADTGSQGALLLDGMQCMAGTSDFDAPSLSAYLNGIRDRAPNTGATVGTATGEDLIIGSGTGKVYAAAVWTRVLTKWEIVVAMNELLGTDIADPRDDAVLILNEPTEDAWADESATGIAMTKSGSPTFSVDHWVTTKTDFWYAANNAVLELGAAKDMTLFLIHAEDLVTPSTVQRNLDKMGESGHGYGNSGYRYYTYSSGSDHWSMIKGTGVAFNEGVLVDGQKFTRATLIDADITDQWVFTDAVFDGSGGTGALDATGEDLRIGGGEGELYGFYAWNRMLALEELAVLQAIIDGDVVIGGDPDPEPEPEPETPGYRPRRRGGSRARARR